jgi:hypothetical protein
LELCNLVTSFVVTTSKGGFGRVLSEKQTINKESNKRLKTETETLRL